VAVAHGIRAGLTMLRHVWFIASRDLKLSLHSRETILWVFIMPVFFFWFIGTVTSGFGSSRGEPTTPLAIEGEKDGGFLAAELRERLAQQGYRVLTEEAGEAFAESTRRLRVPAGFTDSVLARTPVVIRYEHQHEGIGAEYEQVRVGRAAYTVLADVIVSARDGATPAAETVAAVRTAPRPLTLAVESAGVRRRAPSGFEQAIPGILVMFTLLVMTTSGAVLLVVERRQGLLRRLASAPIDRRSIVGGKWVGRLGLGLVQLAFGMITGTVIFGMDWGPNFVVVLLVLVLYAAMMAALGMFLGCIARTEGQSIASGVLASNTLAALGGCWWPIEIAPAWMQKVSLFLPTGWAMNALHGLVSFGASPWTVLPNIAAMIGLGAALLLAAARTFRWE
jgi:ABC-type Na+ efflux pump permease subunit